jgi:integrase
LAQTYPHLVTFAEVTRDQLLAYAEAFTTMSCPRTGQLFAAVTIRNELSSVALFLQDIAQWEWEDAPVRPLMQLGDLPKRPFRIPRYIPDHELGPLMQAIRELENPYQRTALLIARWSGARRDEIRRLALDCLDQYSDGTYRLRIPAGKTRRERAIPLNDEAALAIKELQAVRKKEQGSFRERGFVIL